MKLRLKGSAVRLRLGPSEVDRLVKTGSVTEKTCFGPASLSYTLDISPAAGAIATTFEAGHLRVTLPPAVAARWASTPAEISLAAEQDVGTGRPLSILVEKDFECLHGEKDEDAFQRP